MMTVSGTVPQAHVCHSPSGSADSQMTWREQAGVQGGGAGGA